MTVEEEELQYRRTVGERVRAERIRGDRSQKDLAHAAGVTRNFVSALERGSQRLDAYRLGKLAAALSIPLQQLLSTDGPHAAGAPRPT